MMLRVTESSRHCLQGSDESLKVSIVCCGRAPDAAVVCMREWKSLTLRRSAAQVGVRGEGGSGNKVKGAKMGRAGTMAESETALAQSSGGDRFIT